MKKVFQSIVFIVKSIIMICCFAGCSSFSGSGEKGEIITTSQFKELKKQKSSDGKRVAVIGKVTVANSNLTRKIGSATSMTVEDKDGKLIDFFELNLGRDKNKFYLPVEFTPQDLKTYDNDGKEHPFNELIQISFTMRRITEVRPEQDPLTSEYYWEFEQIRIDPVK